MKMKLLIINLAWLILFSIISNLPQTNGGLLKNIKNKKLVTNVELFEQCRDHPDTDVLFTDLKLVQANATMFQLNGKINFRKTIEKKWTVHFNMKKCKNRDNLSSCSKFFETTTSDCCEVIQSKGQLWTSFVENIKLTETCPIHPATYTINNFEMSSDYIRFLPMDESFFMIRVTSHSQGKLIVCVDAHLMTTIA